MAITNQAENMKQWKQIEKARKKQAVSKNKQCEENWNEEERSESEKRNENELRQLKMKKADEIASSGNDGRNLSEKAWKYQAMKYWRACEWNEERRRSRGRKYQ